MELQKTKKTSRKFYNKWIYKVSLNVKGTAIFRAHSLDYIKEFCTGENSDNRPHSIFGQAWQNKDQILALSDFLTDKDPTIWSKRIENTNIDFYTNDKLFYESISETFQDSLIHRFEPDDGVESLLDQPQVIVSHKLPHNKYRYRVYLLPHKLANNKEAKLKYIDWLKSQSPRITCTTAVEKWFIKTDWNWDRRYVLVEDEHTLLMLKLRNSEVVGRVYNYVVADK
jgi:hypothetical protein